MKLRALQGKWWCHRCETKPEINAEAIRKSVQMGKDLAHAMSDEVWKEVEIEVRQDKQNK